MAISIRQFKAVYEKVLLEVLRSGRVPSFDEVVTRAGDALRRAGEPLSPVYSYIPQTADAVFDIELYNEAVRRTLLDLQVLFDEHNEIEIKNIQRIMHADLFHGVHMFELGRLNRTLDALLFSLEAADDNFFANFENFTDLSKTDTALATAGIVDAEEGCLSLPIATKGTMKIALSHLYSLTSVNALVTPNGLVNRGNIPGSTFGNMFKNTTPAWGMVLESETNGPAEVSFAFRLAREEFVNRITLIHHGTSPQTVFVETSVDNVNRKVITDYSSGVTLTDQSRVVGMDFDDRLVDYVHMRMHKGSADRETPDHKFEYIFGLKNISLFTTGRDTTAQYVSLPFDFSDNLPAVGKVALAAHEAIPENCSVDWSVGLTDTDGALQGSYMPIAPQSRAVNTGLPKVINVQDVLSNVEKFVSSSGTYTNVMSFNSINLYQIKTLGTEPIFGTAKLYRGGEAWYRDQTGTFKPVLIKDNFIPFSKGDVQSLYVTKQEATTIQQLSSSASTTETVALLSQKPLYGDGHFMVPPQSSASSIGVDQDTTPNYAIYSVTQSVVDVALTEEDVDFSGGLVDLGKPNIIYEQKGDVVVVEYDTNTGSDIVTFVDGEDFIVELNSAGKPTGIIQATESSPLLVGPSVPGTSRFDIRYTLDKDLTRFVSNIKNNQVLFAELNASTAISVVIKYRYAPLSVLKASIKAKQYFGIAGEKKIYQQGIDYIFDSLSGTIQRLSTGDIGAGTDIYADFKYNDTTEALEQFYLWAWITNTNGIKVRVRPKDTGGGSWEVNRLLVDTDSGEQFAANIPGLGVVDLTSAIEWPQMSGWVQFIVKCQTPGEATYNWTPLIDQVILLQDEHLNYVFVQGGNYFSELTAIRESMKQVSLSYLKTNVFKEDRTYFAVDSTQINEETVYRVIVNFEPNSTDELYSYVVDPVAGIINSIDERWRVEWVNKESSNALTNVVVRAQLTRASTLDGNITPKVFSYFVKVAY